MSRLLHPFKIPNFLCISLPPSPISSMEVASFLHHFTTAPATFTTHQSTKFPAPHCSLNSPQFPSRNPAALRKKKKIPTKDSSSFPPRDRIIYFGKYKGWMLGSLPSSYLQWMSKNLTGFGDWPKLAAAVLDDPVYRDRIEWEYVQRITHGDFGGARIREDAPGDAVAEIYEISEKFDWDMEDKKGWSEVDSRLLGTSFGGRIPRKKEGGKAWWSTREKFDDKADLTGEGGERRRERRERRIQKSERELGIGLGLSARKRELGRTREESRSDGGDNDDDQEVIGKRQDPTVQTKKLFPGRDSFFKKVFNSRSKRSSS